MTLANGLNSLINVIKHFITDFTGVLDSPLSDYNFIVRYKDKGKNNLSSAQFYNLIILLLSSNAKGSNLVFRVALFPNILNQKIHIKNVFSVIKDNFFVSQILLNITFHAVLTERKLLRSYWTKWCTRNGAFARKRNNICTGLSLVHHSFMI